MFKKTRKTAMVHKEFPQFLHFWQLFLFSCRVVIFDKINICLFNSKSLSEMSLFTRLLHFLSIYKPCIILRGFYSLFIPFWSYSLGCLLWTAGVSMKYMLISVWIDLSASRKMSNFCISKSNRTAADFLVWKRSN